MEKIEPVACVEYLPISAEKPCYAFPPSGAVEGDVPLYAQSTIDALLLQLERLKAACDQWSERELLFGAHEDLEARAERAEEDAAEWKQRWIGAKVDLLVEVSGYMEQDAFLKAEECATRLTLLDGAKRAALQRAAMQESAK